MGTKKVLAFSDEDNVAVALEAISVGDRIAVNNMTSEITAGQDIPQGHKIALCDIAPGEAVLKYGHRIGTAQQSIKKGEYVHNFNVSDTVANWPDEVGKAVRIFDKKTVPSDEFVLEKLPELYGYRRRNGSVGFRNHVLVVSTCVCANTFVKEVEFRDRDLICIESPSGCLIMPNEVKQQNDLFSGLALNPNTGAVIFVGLGCESINARALFEKAEKEKPAAYFLSQNEGTTAEMVDKIFEKAEEFKALLSKQKREKVSFSDIRLGTKCGASDWTSAAASNPAIGYASDVVVRNGGISLLGETCGWFGGEDRLVEHSRDDETAEKIYEKMSSIYNRCRFYGKSIEEGNPSPGNIAGGISTLKEKAIGNIMKGGTAPIEGLLEVGQQPEGKGLYICDNVGIDPASLFSLTASSATVLLYSTGRGSPVGTPLAPSIKLTASPTAQQTYLSHMDVDLTDMVLEGTSVAEGGMRLINKIVEVANGEKCVAEQEYHREYAFPLMMGPV